MWSNPEPDQTLSAIFSKSPIMKAHADRPKKTDLFEAQGRMARVRLKKLKIFVGKFLYFFWELPVVKPEFG